MVKNQCVQISEYQNHSHENAQMYACDFNDIKLGLLEERRDLLKDDETASAVIEFNRRKKQRAIENDKNRLMIFTECNLADLKQISLCFKFDHEIRTNTMEHWMGEREEMNTSETRENDYYYMRRKCECESTW